MSFPIRLFVLMLGLAALPALAADSLGDIAGCPAGKAVTTDAPATDAERDATRQATPSTPAAGATTAGSGQRARPRWQSFLPGMIR